MIKQMKSKKGQLMVLDIIFALVILILMIFLLTKWVEIKAYQSNDATYNYNLNNTFNTSFNLLTNNKEINCYAYDSDNNYLIPGCFAIDSNVSKVGIGLPSDYNCNFIIDSFILSDNECIDVISIDSNNFIEFDFNVVTYGARAMTKDTYLSNILDDSSTITKRQARLVIWKWLQEKVLLFP